MTLLTLKMLLHRDSPLHNFSVSVVLNAHLKIIQNQNKNFPSPISPSQSTIPSLPVSLRQLSVLLLPSQYSLPDMHRALCCLSPNQPTPLVWGLGTSCLLCLGLKSPPSTTLLFLAQGLGAAQPAGEDLSIKQKQCPSGLHSFDRHFLHTQDMPSTHFALCTSAKKTTLVWLGWVGSSTGGWI